MVQLVNCYDINGVMMNVYDRHFATSKGLLIGYFRGIDESEKLLTQGVYSGELRVDLIPAAVKRLNMDRKQGIESMTLSTHPLPRQHAEFASVGLEGRISQYNAVYPKSVPYFLEFASRLKDQGKKLNLFADNDEGNVRNAVFASMILSTSDQDFSVYFVKPDAKPDEIGETDYGFIVVKSVGDIGEVEHKGSSYRPKNGDLKRVKKLKSKKKKGSRKKRTAKAKRAH